MLTAFGKLLRKIRIDRSLLLKDMATALNCSAPFLSAIETGNKKIPVGFVDRICEAYDLDRQTSENLRNAADISAKEVRIGLNEMNDSSRELVLTFARRFKSLDAEQQAKITSVLKGETN